MLITGVIGVMLDEHPVRERGMVTIGDEQGSEEPQIMTNFTEENDSEGTEMRSLWREKRRLKTILNWRGWLCVSILILILGSASTYAFSVPGPEAGEVNLNQVEDPTMKSQARSRVVREQETEPVYRSNEVFPRFEWRLALTDQALDGIYEIRPLDDLEGVISQLDHVVNFLEDASIIDSYDMNEMIAYLNMNLKKHGHFRLKLVRPDSRGTYIFQLWKGGDLLPYVLKDSTEWAFGLIHTISKMVEKTKNMKHVARVYHLFDRRAADDWPFSDSMSMSRNWYLEETLTPLNITRDIDIDTIRTITQDVVKGLYELHEEGIEHDHLDNLNNIGYTFAVGENSERTKVYKITRGTFPIRGQSPMDPYDRIGVGNMLIAINEKLSEWTDLKAVNYIGKNSSEIYPFFGPIGESPECIDFIIWSTGASQVRDPDDGIRWRNLLQVHPFLSDPDTSPAWKQTRYMRGHTFQ